MDDTVKNGAQRNNKGQFGRGNTVGGRRKGGLNKATLFNTLTDDKAEELIKKIIDQALDGCLPSQRLWADRYFPIATMQIEQLQSQLDEIKDLLELRDEPSQH
jgi:lambda repressor-like predicted transcriptional regulator